MKSRIVLRYVLPIFTLFLLSACGPCIDADYMSNTFYYDTIYVEDFTGGQNSNGMPGTIIIPSDNPGSVEVRFVSNEIQLCDPYVYEYNQLVSGVTLESGRSGILSLAPYATELFNESVCETNMGAIGKYYFDSKEQCKSKAGTTFTIDYGPNGSASGTNLDDIFYNNVKLIADSELSRGEAYVFSVMDAEHQTTQSNAMMAFSDAFGASDYMEEYNEVVENVCSAARNGGVNQTCESLGFVPNIGDTGGALLKKEYSCSLYLPMKYLSFRYINSSFCGAICGLTVTDPDSISGGDLSSIKMSMVTDDCLVNLYSNQASYSGMLTVESIIPNASLGDFPRKTFPVVGVSGMDSITGLLVGPVTVGSGGVYKLQNASPYKVRLTMDCQSPDSGLFYRLNSGGGSVTNWEKVNFEGTNAAFIDMGKNHGKTGALEYKVVLTGNDNVSGNYMVRAKLPRTFPTIISNFLIKIRNSVVKIVYGEVNISENNDILGIGTEGPVGWIYQNLIRNFSQAVIVLMTLAITITGLFFLMGSTNNTQYEFVVLLFKMIAVIVMFSENSWNILYNNFFAFFVVGMDELVKIFTYDAINQVEAVNVFSLFDSLLGRFFVGETWLQIIAIFATGPLGWFACLIIIAMIRDLIVCCIKATFIYLTSMVLVAMMISIAPLFFSFLLFKYTKRMFDQWVKIMMNTIMQPAIVFLSISVLSQVVIAIIAQVFSFSICTQTVLCLQIPDVDFLPKIPLWNQYTAASYDAGFAGPELVPDTEYGGSFFGLPFGFTSLMAAVFASMMIVKIIDYAPIIIETLFGTMMLGLSGVANQLTQSTASMVAMDDASRDKRADKQHRKKLDADQMDIAKHDSKVRDIKESGGRESNTRRN